MLLTWWRRRRRRRILARPFPEQWERWIERNFAQYRWLGDDERAKLRRCVQIFVAEKYWEGCGGLEMTDEIKVTIAAQACLLVLGFEEECFDRLLTVLVYPGDYFAKEVEQRGGIVIEGMSWRLGEAWYGGPVILSWPHVLEGGRTPDNGTNVVFHEFAHVLDMLDQDFDGTPPLQNAEQYRTWQQVMTAEYEELVRQSERGRPTLLDEYGSTSEAEFFAVATECFFEQPRQMAARHPRLYELLGDFYRQDPAARAPG
jgi:MtfA peptidase